MKKSICSLVGIIVAVGDAVAGIRVGNLSRNYAGSYKNTAALEQQYYNSIASNPQDVPVNVALPVPVADAELAQQIKTGDTDARVDTNTLNKCAMIYPDGEFVWDVPTMGMGAGGKATCVAVVEMRQIKASGSKEHTTVARGKVAAGDMFRCNISDFPVSGYLPEMSQVVFPADKGPTREDVIAVMNEEQKGKAGLKIAAAALVGGLGGNLVGKSDPGDDKLLGTNKEKLKTTAIGAATGAAIMAASAYSGKVAGDVILHTSVNAAAGGVVGNIAQSGESVLRVEKCMDGSRETTCLWGSLVNTSAVNEPNAQFYATIDGKNIFGCAPETSGATTCRKRPDLIVTTVAGEKPGKYTRVSELEMAKADATRYYFNTDGDKIQNKNESSESDTTYFEAVVAKRGTTIPAVIVDFQDSAFGTKVDAWGTWKESHRKETTKKICRRDGKGNPTECGALKKAPQNGEEEGEPFTVDDFNPGTLDADDGSVIDLSNKARLGSTLKGAGVGGAMGAFSGYQGAQADIEDRFVQATREYRDSLQKFYCGTGQKFISFYNDDAPIPAMGN